ncbi:MAG: Sau3AI family type II restriction endonuclease [Candidatus Saccharibacteria bacterium]|nr:Sau3AI family type II restriction endonuclease [Candidatus Saccharibacteria bacterium]
MTQLPYDLTSPQSILQFAAGLSGKTLSQAVNLVDTLENVKNKGDLGTMVERYYFGYEPNSTKGPDFAEAGVELKTTGVKKASTGKYKAKERLVLNMIDYVQLVDEQWSNSSLLAKCRVMLILFYLYEKDVPVFDRRFVLDPVLFSFPVEDLAVIQRDWETIRDKILAGKAHELSEGDTFYLAACRKGSGGVGEKLRKQPFSDVGAKSRAFSLKPSYVNRIINDFTSEASSLDITDGSIEAATEQKFQPYLGMAVDDIALKLDFHKKGKNDKGYYSNLTMRILGGKKLVTAELEKAGIEPKTIRVNKNWMPKEAMSFPTFKYMEIIDEQWEDSKFYSKIEQKFLFVVYRYDENDVLRLEGVKYWNMPYSDRVEAQRVWEDTRRRVGVDASDLPSSSESTVAHVRPKGRNALDVLPTPQGTMLQKKCFWLNKAYIASQIR